MPKALKRIAFVLVAAVSLVAGCILADELWQLVHHRYDTANTGWYYGHTRASFISTTHSVYTFEFNCQTETRWYWLQPRNFTYRKLDFNYFTYAFDPNRSEGTGTVSLPSLAYESTQGTGVLTSAVLREWLTGFANTNKQDLQSMDIIFTYIKAAGNGSLPRPKHHGYYTEKPIMVSLQHFLCGRGVGVFVYIWMGVWAVLVLRMRRILWRPSKGNSTGEVAG